MFCNTPFNKPRSFSSNGSDSNVDKNQNKGKPGKKIQSRFMNPIVSQLWDQRQEQQQQKNDDLSPRFMSLTDSDSETTGSGNLSEVTASLYRQGKDAELDKHPQFKHPRHSKVFIDYPFASDEFLLESYKSPGGTMRFGKVLEDLDALAGNISFRHVVGNPMLVTAAVDRIALRQIPVMCKNQRLSGQVTWVGTSSMEIRMQICELGENEQVDDPWLEAYFTFVAVDPDTNKPIKICPLIPESSEERALFELGSLKAAKKKQNRKQNSIIAGERMSEEVVAQEKRAEKLLQDAFPLLRLPSLADPNSILMSHTMMQNTLIAQPQVRNLNDRIFGGFLMRRAFELAFANAYTFGGEWPQMLEVDNITFHRPVDVGNLLQFQSRVIYSLPEGGDLGPGLAPHRGKPLIMIEVLCTILIPEEVKAHVTNRFYFTFLLPKKESCRMVLPGTLEEARGMVARMVADEEQAGFQKGYLCRQSFEDNQ